MPRPEHREVELVGPQATRIRKRNKPMRIRNTLLASSAALVLSAGAAAAAPATAQSNVNVRSGPGTQYPVVGALRGGETVDVADCTGSWCQISFSGGTGYASQNYLAMAGGGGPGYAAVAPGYVDQGEVYDDTPGYAYNDYYYDDYGPSVGFYVSPRFRHHRHGWHGRPHVGGQWQGRPGWNGGNRVGGVGAPSGRMGNVGPGFNPGGVGAPVGRMGNVGAGVNPGGVGAPTGRMGNFGAGFGRGGGGSPQMSAPTGMRMGGGVGGGGGRIGGGGGGGGGGGARGGVGAPGR
jgi:uncharacterized protein YraI